MRDGICGLFFISFGDDFNQMQQFFISPLYLAKECYFDFTETVK